MSTFTPHYLKPLEKDLHRQIMVELRRRGLFFVRSSMGGRPTIRPGTPDFILAIPSATGAVPVGIEVKSTSLKSQLSPAQIQVRDEMLACGWQHHTVRTFDEFIAILDGPRRA